MHKETYWFTPDFPEWMRKQDVADAFFVPWSIRSSLLPRYNHDGEFIALLSAARRTFEDTGHLSPWSRTQFSNLKRQTLSIIPSISQLQLGSFLILEAIDGYASKEEANLLGEYIGEAIHSARIGFQQLFSESLATLRNSKFKGRLEYCANKIDEIGRRTLHNLDEFSDAVAEYAPI